MALQNLLLEKQPRAEHHLSFVSERFQEMKNKRKTDNKINESLMRVAAAGPSELIQILKAKL